MDTSLDVQPAASPALKWTADLAGHKRSDHEELLRKVEKACKGNGFSSHLRMEASKGGVSIVSADERPITSREIMHLMDRIPRKLHGFFVEWKSEGGVIRLRAPQPDSEKKPKTTDEILSGLDAEINAVKNLIAVKEAEIRSRIADEHSKKIRDAEAACKKSVEEAQSAAAEEGTKITAKREGKIKSLEKMEKKWGEDIRFFDAVKGVNDLNQDRVEEIIQKRGLSQYRYSLEDATDMAVELKDSVQKFLSKAKDTHTQTILEASGSIGRMITAATAYRAGYEPALDYLSYFLSEDLGEDSGVRKLSEMILGAIPPGRESKLNPEIKALPVNERQEALEKLYKEIATWGIARLTNDMVRETLEILETYVRGQHHRISIELEAERRAEKEELAGVEAERKRKTADAQREKDNFVKGLSLNAEVEAALRIETSELLARKEALESSRAERKRYL